MKRFSLRRSIPILAIVLSLLLPLGLLCACDKGGVSDTTSTLTDTTRVPTEAPTDDVTEAPDTEDTTDGDTEETTSEEPVETLPADKPTDSAVLTFCDTPLNATWITPNVAAEFSVVQDSEQGSVLKLTVADSKRISDPYVKIDYAAYMEAAGLDPVAWNDCGAALILMKVEKATNTLVEMTAYNKSGTKAKSISGSNRFSKTEAGWQYVMIPLVEESAEGGLTELRLDFLDNPAASGETVYVKSITFVKDKVAALQMMGTVLVNPSTATVVIPGLTKEYTFLHATDIHASAFSATDIAAWTATRLNYNTSRRNSFVSGGLFAEERFPLLFDYATEIGADGMFLTGDLIDFPSEKNIALLYNNVNRFGGKPIFCLGNHDWNYSDDYMTGNAATVNRPLFNDLTSGDPYISYTEYDEFLVVAIDNSSDVVTQETVDKFLALYEKDKPIILLLHVPFHVDTLEPTVKSVWGRNITMGPGAMGSDWSSVVQLYNAVCVAEDTPVVAVFTGHVHLNHEDVFPNGVPQYVTSTGYTGDCRVVTVKGN